MTRPVLRSYSPSTSSRVRGRVTGTSPRKWSAWVVPMQRTGSRACAKADAASEWVWTIPPQPKAR